MKNFIISILIIISFQSCSNNDDSNDKIIGKWVIVERLESETQIDLSCSEHTYIEFKTNNEMVGGFLDYNSIPEECRSLNFYLLTWEKNGDKYFTYQLQNDINSEFFFDGYYLVSEPRNIPNNRFIYERLN